MTRRTADALKFSRSERDAVYRAIFERRDVRRNFLPRAISEPVMMRLLTAAHHAGSVGFMQPWDFVVIRNAATKRAVKQLFVEANTEAARRYTGLKGDLYRRLKLEGIEEAPINLCVTCSRRRGGADVLGRSTVRATDLYSTCCAVQNLWLAARAEGIGVGWVSILDHEALKRVVGVPKSVTILAYLCLGYVSKFETAPDLEMAGWRDRIPVNQLIHYDAWGSHAYEEERDEHENHEGLHQNGRRGKDKTRRRPTGVEGQSSSRSLRHRR